MHAFNVGLKMCSRLIHLMYFILLLEISDWLYIMRIVIKFYNTCSMAIVVYIYHYLYGNILFYLKK